MFYRNDSKNKILPSDQIPDIVYFLLLTDCLTVGVYFTKPCDFVICEEILSASRPRALQLSSHNSNLPPCLPSAPLPAAWLA